jgi:hypothetical protein
VTVYAIAEHHLVHTCPANPQPHAVDIQRGIIHAAPGRPCQQPVTIRIGNTTAVIPCGRHETSARQCGACRPLITIVQVTMTDLGYQAGTGQQSAPTGLHPDPCPVCGLRVAAILPRHLLCRPTTARTRATA